MVLRIKNINELPATVRALNMPAHVRVYQEGEKPRALNYTDGIGLYHGRPKIKTRRVEIDHYKFPSQLQARRYLELKALRAAGAIRYFLCEVAFMLPGGFRHRVDFQIVGNDGQVRYEDAKARETEKGYLKRKQVEALYGITVELWSDNAKHRAGWSRPKGL